MMFFLTLPSHPCFGSFYEKTIESWGEEATLWGAELLLESVKIAREININKKKINNNNKKTIVFLGRTIERYTINPLSFCRLLVVNSAETAFKPLPLGAENGQCTALVHDIPPVRAWGCVHDLHWPQLVAKKWREKKMFSDIELVQIDYETESVHNCIYHHKDITKYKYMTIFFKYSCKEKCNLKN